MKTAGIRFERDIYLHISVENGNISLYTVDAEGNKKDYTVTETNRRSRKTEKTEDK